MRSRLSKRVALKIAFIVVTASIACLAILRNADQPVLAFSSGPLPGYTNAPGDVGNCTACHNNFDLNSGPGSVQIAGVPHDYRPGQNVQIHVTTGQVGAQLFGFELTAIDSTGHAAGTFTIPSGANSPMRLRQLDLGGGVVRDYVEQSSSGLFDPQTFDSNTWTFTWTAPAELVGKVSFYAAGNAADGDGGTDGDDIYTTSRAALSGSAISNFDGDQASDIAVFRPRIGKWYSRKLDDASLQTFTFGAEGDNAVPGDYDGDGTTDLAVFTPSTSQWKIQLSSGGGSSSAFGCFGPGCGTPVPVQGDYDGDGKTDIALFYASTGTWMIRKSSGGTMSATLGQTGDKVAQADYDGDGKTDVAVFRPSNGTWYLLRSSLGLTTIQFGTATDRPVQADYDGDGKADIAYFRPSTATWYINTPGGGIVRPFGASVDTPSPADYDGDGKADIAVFHPGKRGLGATWHVLRSSDLSTVDVSLGLARDVPVASGYLSQ